MSGDKAANPELPRASVAAAQLDGKSPNDPIAPNEDPKSQLEYSFDFKFKDVRGKEWQGPFTNRILSIRQRQQQKVLKARLLERALEEKEEAVRQLKGEHVEAGWGNQIRSYVLHPYQMVKELRTNYETGNTSAVLDGDLDAFMQAELERGIGEETVAK